MDDDVTPTAVARQMHRHAMELVDMSVQAQRDGDLFLTGIFRADASYWEEWAAHLVTTEPSRAVLYRSAAALALEAGWPERARELAMRGLEGAPPDAIADELRGVLARC